VFIFFLHHFTHHRFAAILAHLTSGLQKVSKVVVAAVLFTSHVSFLARNNHCESSEYSSFHITGLC